jgi:hypothetical protein
MRALANGSFTGASAHIAPARLPEHSDDARLTSKSARRPPAVNREVIPHLIAVSWANGNFDRLGLSSL